MANSANPYLDIAKAYEEGARRNLASQEAVLANQLAASKNATNASYDSSAAGNYANYVKQQNALPEQLARQGVTGGASETALTRMANNYALNQGNNEASRNSALGQLQTSYDTNLANLRQAVEENILNNNMSLQQNEVQYQDTLAQRAAEEARYREEVERNQRWRDEDQAIAEADKQYERSWAKLQYKDNQKAKMLEEFAAGLARYNDVDSLNKMAKKLKAKKGWTKDPYTYGRVQAIYARIGELGGSGGSGGGGGGRSYGGRSYGGGGYSSSSGGDNGGGTTQSESILTQIARDALKNATSSKKKSSKKTKSGGGRATKQTR